MMTKTLSIIRELILAFEKEIINVNKNYSFNIDGVMYFRIRNYNKASELVKNDRAYREMYAVKDDETAFSV